MRLGSDICEDWQPAVGLLSHTFGLLISACVVLGNFQAKARRSDDSMVASLLTAAAFVFREDLYPHRTEFLSWSHWVDCTTQGQMLLLWPLTLKPLAHWQHYSLIMCNLQGAPLIFSACSLTTSIDLYPTLLQPHMSLSPSALISLLHPRIGLLNIYQIVICVLQRFSRQLAAFASSRSFH